MRRLTAMMTSASAAALATAAVTVAVPAIADNAGDPKGADPLAACLRAHGLAGAPDGAGLKDWLGPRLKSVDAATRRAMEACAPKSAPGAGPSVQEIRSCLMAHGADVPRGDGRVLKQWILEHPGDAALKACGMAPPPKGARNECGPVKPSEPAGADRKKT
jgi:hypothetical protein